MSTAALSTFLIVHGLLHLAIWMPHPNPDAGKPPPFVPDHSTLLTATRVPEAATHQLSIALAVGSAAGFVLTGVGVALSAGWAVPMAIASALLGPCPQGGVLSPMADHRRTSRPDRALRSDPSNSMAPGTDMNLRPCPSANRFVPTASEAPDAPFLLSTSDRTGER